jgi:UDP-GlcNAc:undecaprenyl-phosphate GlcNAc-1-phosphate transferase
MIVLFVIGAYRGIWQYFSLIDSVQFVKAVVFGSAAAQLIILYLYRFQDYSRTVFFIYAALLLLLLTATRASFRLISEFASRRRRSGARLVIYGAGGGGAIAVREVMANAEVPYRIVGFIDDVAEKRGIRVHGYHVLGGLAKLERMIERQEVDAILVSCRRMDPKRVEAVERLAGIHGTKLIRLQLSIEQVDSLTPQPLKFPTRLSS